jgi:hypothetical protein
MASSSKYQPMATSRVQRHIGSYPTAERTISGFATADRTTIVATRHFRPSVLTYQPAQASFATKPRLPPREVLWSPQLLHRRVAHERARYRQHPFFSIPLLEGRCYLVPTRVLLIHSTTSGLVQGQGMMRSLFMELSFTRMSERFTRSERPESVARMPIRSVFGG